MTAPNLIDQLEAAGIRPRRVRDGENRCPCPQCDKGERDDALALRIAGDRAVWICHRCGWTGGVSRDGGRRETQPARPLRLPQSTDRREVVELSKAIWLESTPLRGTPGEAYLQRRACHVPRDDGDLRFHAGLFCAKVSRRLPAIVCRVSTVIGNRGIGVHRIFIDPLGSDKAIAKMRLGGSDEPVCVRLFPDEDVVYGLGIAEGIETALAASRLQTPIWATIDAGGMTAFPVIRGVQTLTIFADHDAAGLRAATACAERWRHAGRSVVSLAPARPGADLNDLVREAA